MSDSTREAEIAARADAATPGHWLVDMEEDMAVILKPDKPGSTWDGSTIATVPSGDHGLIEAGNAEFIANAREDIPFLLVGREADRAEIQRLRDQRDAALEYLETEQIPSESDDDWVNARPVIAILRAALTGEPTEGQQP